MGFVKGFLKFFLFLSGGNFPHFLASDPKVADFALDSGVTADLGSVCDSFLLSAEVSGEGDAGSLANVLFVVSSVSHSFLSFLLSVVVCCFLLCSFII